VDTVDRRGRQAQNVWASLGIDLLIEPLLFALADSSRDMREFFFSFFSFVVDVTSRHFLDVKQTHDFVSSFLFPPDVHRKLVSDQLL
jgi:hypothetical protein